jgi:hypothetical protein
VIRLDVYEFLRPTEKGFQVLYDNHALSQDLFLNWRERNTPDKHERFNLGSMSELKWNSGSAALQFLYVHRGGTEYPQEPIVFENLSAAVVLDQSIVFEQSAIRRAGIELVPLFTSDVPPDTPPAKRANGHGLKDTFFDQKIVVTWRQAFGLMP